MIGNVVTNPNKSEEVLQMITITKEAATLLTALKVAEGAPDEAGIRIHRRGVANGSGELAVEFEICFGR